MTLRIFRSIWFLSLLGFLVALLWVYASLPEEVVIQEEGSTFVSLSREVLFYSILLVTTLINALVYVMAKMFKRDENFRAWFHGLIVTLNIFFIVALMVINTYNSHEKFNFSKIGFMVYGSVGLVVAWAIAWPIYSLFRKNNYKETV